MLRLGQKEGEKAQQGERSLAAVQQLASRCPHLVPAECPQRAWLCFLHSDPLTEDCGLPISTIPFDFLFLSSSVFVFWKWLDNSQYPEILELICLSNGKGLQLDKVLEAL